MKNPKLKLFVSFVSAAPLLYLIGLAVSLLLYLAFPIALVPMSAEPAALIAGVVAIGLSTLLVFWAQGISRKNIHRDFGPQSMPTATDFMRGPYKYTRHPGALGLMVMFAGFALVVNSLVMAILLALFIIIETVWFIPMEESVYLDECPDGYGEYRKRVRMWL